MNKNRLSLQNSFIYLILLAITIYWLPPADLSAADLTPLVPQVADILPAEPPESEILPRPEPSGTGAADPNAILVEHVYSISFEYYSAGRTPAQLGLPTAPIPTVVRGVCNQVEALAPALSGYNSKLSTTARAVMSGPLTWAMLDALTLAATEAARECGWSLARAYAPAQELTGGNLRIEIIPVWLEDVQVEGARWSNAARLAKPYRAHTGEIVSLKNLIGPQRLQSGHPFRTVVPSLTPGRTDGATSIKLNVAERRPFRLFAGYHTTHSRNSGVGRFTGGATMVAPWRTDDTWTIQYSTDNKNDHLDSVATVYQSTLPWGHTFTLTGLWSKSDTISNNIIKQESEDHLIRLAYGIPLPDFWGWVSKIELGWEWRHSEAKSRFWIFQLSDNTYVSAPFSLGWSGRHWDRLGVISLSANMSYSPGNYMGRMDRIRYRLNREGAKPEWFVAQADLRRDWILPWDFRGVQRFWGQVTPDRLADSAQFFLGGNNSIRGYRESEVSGDYGIGMTHELLSPSLVTGIARQSCPDAAWLAKLPDVRLAGFWDWGQVRNRRAKVYERKSTTLSGAGVGVRFYWGEYVSAQLDYAWRLRDTGNREDDRKNGYLHASVQIGF